AGGEGGACLTPADRLGPERPEAAGLAGVAGFAARFAVARLPAGLAVAAARRAAGRSARRAGRLRLPVVSSAARRLAARSSAVSSRSAGCQSHAADRFPPRAA